MSTHPPEVTTAAEVLHLRSSIAALVQEITRLKLDLTILRSQLMAEPEAQDGRKVCSLLGDIAQWVGIAIEMEETYEKQFQSPQRSGSFEHALDLDAARASIGGKLDRLRAATSAERVSEQSE
jgi:hypothetical protein